jgi:hypothetical protein
MKKILFNILIILTLTSCNNVENLSKAGNEIAKYFGTKDVTISFTNFTSTDNGSTESYKIDIKNVLEVNNGNYPPEYLASMSAKTLFDNLNKEEREERDNIIVKIEGSNKNFEYNYSMKDFSKVDQYFKITKEFIQKIKFGNLNGLNIYLNENTINLEEFNKNFINGTLLKNKELFKKIEKTDLHSINVSIENNIKIVELITFSVFGDSHIKLSTRFIEKSPDKISGISIF